MPNTKNTKNKRYLVSSLLLVLTLCAVCLYFYSKKTLFFAGDYDSQTPRQQQNTLFNEFRLDTNFYHMKKDEKNKKAFCNILEQYIQSDFKDLCRGKLDPEWAEGVLEKVTDMFAYIVHNETKVFIVGFPMSENVFYIEMFCARTNALQSGRELFHKVEEVLIEENYNMLALRAAASENKIGALVDYYRTKLGFERMIDSCNPSNPYNISITSDRFSNPADGYFMSKCLNSSKSPKSSVVEMKKSAFQKNKSSKRKADFNQLLSKVKNFEVRKERYRKRFCRDILSEFRDYIHPFFDDFILEKCANAANIQILEDTLTEYHKQNDDYFNEDRIQVITSFDNKIDSLLLINKPVEDLKNLNEDQKLHNYLYLSMYYDSLRDSIEETKVGKKIK